MGSMSSTSFDARYAARRSGHLMSYLPVTRGWGRPIAERILLNSSRNCQICQDPLDTLGYFKLKFVLILLDKRWFIVAAGLVPARSAEGALGEPGRRKACSYGREGCSCRQA